MSPTLGITLAIIVAIILVVVTAFAVRGRDGGANPPASDIAAGAGGGGSASAGFSAGVEASGSFTPASTGKIDIEIARFSTAIANFHKMTPEEQEAKHARKADYLADFQKHLAYWQAQKAADDLKPGA